MLPGGAQHNQHPPPFWDRNRRVSHQVGRGIYTSALLLGLIQRSAWKEYSKNFAPTLDCWQHMYQCKATAHSLYERKEGVNAMHVEGITWHAITLQADQFGPTKKLLS